LRNQGFGCNSRRLHFLIPNLLCHINLRLRRTRVCFPPPQFPDATHYRRGPTESLPRYPFAIIHSFGSRVILHRLRDKCHPRRSACAGGTGYFCVVGERELTLGHELKRLTLSLGVHACLRVSGICLLSLFLWECTRASGRQGGCLESALCSRDSSGVSWAS
jgi:hypothetical protein